MTRALRHLRADIRGVAALEFALIAPVFLLLIMGMFDLGHIMLVDSMLQGAVEKAGRDSTLQSGPASATNIDAFVRSQIKTVVPDAAITFDRHWSQDLANAGRGEPFLDNGNSNGAGANNGVRDPGECFQDINGNGRWDDPSAFLGQGGASLAAIYTVSVSYPHWFPMPKLIGVVTRTAQTNGNVNMSASTVLRNQPYANYVVPARICT